MTDKQAKAKEVGMAISKLMRRGMGDLFTLAIMLDGKAMTPAGMAQADEDACAIFMQHAQGKPINRATTAAMLTATAHRLLELVAEGSAASAAAISSAATAVAPPPESAPAAFESPASPDAGPVYTTDADGRRMVTDSMGDTTKGIPVMLTFGFDRAQSVFELALDDKKVRMTPVDTVKMLERFVHVYNTIRMSMPPEQRHEPTP